MPDENGQPATFMEDLQERQRDEEGPLQGRRVGVQLRDQGRPREVAGVIIHERPDVVTVLLQQPHEGSRLIELQRDRRTGGPPVTIVQPAEGPSWTLLREPRRGFHPRFRR